MTQGVIRAREDELDVWEMDEEILSSSNLGTKSDLGDKKRHPNGCVPGTWMTETSSKRVRSWDLDDKNVIQTGAFLGLG